MRPAFPALLLLAVVGLSGCSDDSSPTAAPSLSGYSSQVRENFLTSCVTNAAQTAGAGADEEQLRQTCECTLAKVEQEYSAAEFAQFEQRLLGSTASEQETAQLIEWSTTCAQGPTS